MPEKKDINEIEKMFGSHEPAVKQLEPGTVLNGRYEIVRRLGGGEKGAVYLALDPGNRPWAVKEIGETDLEPSQHEKAIADFKRETMLLTSLDHPSLPTIYDHFYGDQFGRFYLVMEYVSGGDLASHLRNAPDGRIDERTVTEWAIQVADVLEYLHTRPKAIIYQNLKPAKLMIHGNVGRVMLINFSLARGLTQREKSVNAVGTMGYAAPELFAGRVEPRSDVYSLGATMFQLLTGADPQDNPLVIFDFAKSLRPRQIAPSISVEMELILMRAVEYLPEDRFATAGELRDALATHLEKLVAEKVSYGEPAPKLSPLGQRDKVDSLGPPHKVGLPETSDKASDTVQGQTVYCNSCGGRIVADDGSCSRCDDMQLVGMDSSETLGKSDQLDLSSEKPPIYLDENVQFTVYRPGKIKPGTWYPLLAYAHLGESRPDEDSVDPIAHMEAEVERIMAEQRVNDYSRRSEDSLQAIPRQGEISFVPFMAGVEFNPPSSSFLWQESVHGQEFRMRAAAALDGRTARGQLSVFLGTILLAEINLSIQVSSIHADTHQARPQREKPARPYRKVFPSYSHKDREIVAQIEHYAQVTGDRYMRDVYELRSGQNWKKWMAETIAEADIFQLFWSTNSMRSDNVRREWECALGLTRPDFIRPTYWETPLPQSPSENLPPPELKDLHFQHVRPPTSLAMTGTPAENQVRVLSEEQEQLRKESERADQERKRFEEEVAARQAREVQEKRPAKVEQNTGRSRSGVKRCPTCNRTYADNSLAFCLEDGTPLSLDAPQSVSMDAPQSRSSEAPLSPDASATFDYPTRGANRMPAQSYYPPMSSAPAQSPMEQASRQKSSNLLWLILLGIAAIAIAAMGLLIVILVARG